METRTKMSRSDEVEANVSTSKENMFLIGDGEDGWAASMRNVAQCDWQIEDEDEGLARLSCIRSTKKLVHFGTF